MPPERHLSPGQHSIRRPLRWIARYGLLLIGAAILLVAMVMGLLAPTASETWAWVIVELVGVGVVIPGLHISIDWDRR